MSKTPAIDPDGRLGLSIESPRSSLHGGIDANSGAARVQAVCGSGAVYGLTEYFVNAPPAWANEFGPSAA
jgi:hypothetical protein